MKKILKCVLGLVLLVAGCIVGMSNANAATTAGSLTAVVIDLPDDADNHWENTWNESETNVIVRYVSESIPKEGNLSLKFCYPNDPVGLNREESYEIFANDNYDNYVRFTTDEAMVTGKIGNEWWYLQSGLSYVAEDGVLEIKIKTHSESGSVKTKFGVTDIVITGKNGITQKIDLKQKGIEIQCKKGNYWAGELKDCDYALQEIKGDIVVDSIDRDSLDKDSSGDGLYCVTYSIPEPQDDWNDSWTESEVNAICTYSSKSKLSDGMIYATLCVPALKGVERTDNFELAVHAYDDFMNFNSTGVEVKFSEDCVYANGMLIPEENGYCRIPVKVKYNSLMLYKETDVQVRVKSHSIAKSGAYKVSVCDMIVWDKNFIRGKLVDFSSDNVSLEVKMYANGKPVDHRLSERVIGFYIMNPIEKIVVKATYKLKVYNPDNSKLTYRSSNKKVATVNKNGKITACGKGRCEITVKKNATGETASFVLLVGKPSIILNDCEILMIVGRDKDCSVETDFARVTPKYRWSSSKPAVADVSRSGKIHAKKTGTVKITVEDTANKVKKSFKLTVYKPKDADKVGEYIFLANTSYVTVDVAKKSYDILYAVYKNVFDYFNDGQYEPVTLYFTRNDYSPAYSDMADIYLSSEYMLSNPKDVDCITHELIHCAQNYGYSTGDSVWLLEGLTDYGRYLFGLHNEECGWALPEYRNGQHYTDSYTVTAAFIKYVTENHCTEMPQLINQMFKTGTYDESIWKNNTGYSIDELWNLYVKDK